MTAEDDHDLLVRIDEKVDALLIREGDHEIRIRSLEKWRYGIPAGLTLTILTAIATFVHH